MEGTDTSHKRDSRSSDKFRKSEDASNSQEEENAVSEAFISLAMLCDTWFDSNYKNIIIVL